MPRSNAVLLFATQYMQTGGIESHLKEFCNQFSHAGVAIDLVILNSKMLPSDEKFFRKICRKVFLGRQGRSNLRLFWLLGVGTRLSRNRYRALYTNGQGESILLFSILVFKRLTWVHHHHTSGDVADQLTWGRLYQVALRHADSIIACSQRVAFEIQGVVGRAIDVVPCFSRKVAQQTQGRTRKDAVRFGYFGRLIKEKGIDTICRLSEDADLNGTEFHLWGEGAMYPPAFFDHFPNVRFHGVFHNQSQLEAAVDSLDGFLLISTHPEGLPICLLEVMSAGLPWLATDKGGIADIALDPVSTRIIPADSDYEEIKRQVLALAAAIRTGQTSRARQVDLYNRNFSPAALITQWVNILQLKSRTVYNPLVAS